MRALALVMGLVVSTTAFGQSPEVAAESPLRGRGWLTGLGVGLVGAGIASLAIGGVFAANGAEADALAKPYNGAPTHDQAVGANALDQRSKSNWGAALPLFVSGGVLIAGGVVCAVLDSVFSGGPKVTFISLPKGGVVALSGSF